MQAKTFLLVLVGLSGCAGYGDVSQQAPDTVVSVDRNYQAVYAGMVTAMRTCLNPGTTDFFHMSSAQLDAQLYPDLGYGEIVHSLSAVTTDTLEVVKISRAESGATVEIRVGNQLPYAAANSVQWLTYWAKGGTSCPTGLLTSPPSI